MGQERRVGALLSMNAGVAHLLGFGVYLGEKQMPDALIAEVTDYTTAELALMAPESKKFHNPCIRLDNGRHVWGIQCWWGSEDKIKARIDGAKVEEATLPDYPPSNV